MDNTQNLVAVGIDHYADLPHLLQQLIPITGCANFVNIDAGFGLFRHQNKEPSVPFLSQQEYLDGQIPALSADSRLSSLFDSVKR